VSDKNSVASSTPASGRDNPFDWRTQPKEHAAWRDAYRTARLESQSRKQGFGDSAFRENAETAQEQCQFALVWRPFFRPFQLRVNDVVRVDGNRLGRVIRVTECAAVVLFNPPARSFKARFDKQVRFQPQAVTVRIAADSGTEILNRKVRKKHRNNQTERRSA